LREAAPETLSRILGLVTHDLRNPLAALSSNIGFLQMVGSEFSGEVREAVDDLVLSVEALGRIVDSLELVGHDLASRSFPPPVAVAVGSILRAVSPHVERGAKSHGVTVEWDQAAAENASVVAAEQPLVLSLSALLHNAVTVSPARSIVRCSVVVQGNEVQFVVQDDGPALTLGMRERALRADEQADIKGERGARYSRGLGLYAVAQAAQLAGVEVLVGNHPGGSEISLVGRRA
jgi:signal transduction histidine kinase